MVILTMVGATIPIMDGGMEDTMIPGIQDGDMEDIMEAITEAITEAGDIRTTEVLTGMVITTDITTGIMVVHTMQTPGMGRLITDIPPDMEGHQGLQEVHNGPPMWIRKTGPVQELTRVRATLHGQAL